MSSSPAGLPACHVWRCSSSQRPLSFQSWPRVGTIISSVRKKLPGVIRLLGFSVRSVHACTGSASATTTAESHVKRSEFFTGSLLLERDPHTGGHGTGTRIRQIVDVA